MTLTGYVLVLLLCKGDDCEAKPLSPRIYATEQECKDELWAQVGYYRINELTCAEVRR